MKKLWILVILIIAVININAQEQKKLSRKERKRLEKERKIEETKTMLEQKAFIFVPDQVIPMGMRSKTLNGEFDARIENDTIVCYLPYFGRSHSATYGSNEGPMDFTQPIENYKFEKDKKGYVIEFDVKNKNDRIEFRFRIFDTGTASLSVTSNYRSPISYNGELKKPDKK